MHLRFVRRTSVRTIMTQVAELDSTVEIVAVIPMNPARSRCG